MTTTTTTIIYHVTYNDFFEARFRYPHHVDGGEFFTTDERTAWLQALTFAGEDAGFFEHAPLSELRARLSEIIETTGDEIRVHAAPLA